MAPKAQHISKAPLNWYKTVDRLFAAAFNQSSSAFKHASLCGWRPLSPGVQLQPLLTGGEDDGQWAVMDSPGVVILETETGFRIEIEIPEIKEESLYLEVSGETLIVRGERTEPLEPSPEQSIKGRFFFERFIQLPVEVRPGQVRARLLGHIIRVVITK